VRIDQALFASFSWSVGLGVALGLIVGKPLGIVGASWLAARTGAAVLPAGANWRMVHGIGWLGGIGFTMSLFIAGLAFGGTSLLDSAKVGILVASLVSGTVGWIVMRRATARRDDEPLVAASTAAPPSASPAA
jgi:NhaA family Na+:H+ antiporter